jgi:hypothetical protein
VNVGLVLKFMPNYTLNPKDYPEIPTGNDAADNVYCWNQCPVRRAGKVQFADWTPVYERHARIPNVALPRAGPGVQAATHHRRSRRGTTDGLGFPAQRGTHVLTYCLPVVHGQRILERPR